MLGRMNSMCKGQRLKRRRPILRIANSPVCLESDEERRGRGRQEPGCEWSQSQRGNHLVDMGSDEKLLGEK